MSDTDGPALIAGHTSKVLGYRSFGGPEVQEYLERPVPVPGPSEVLVRVTAVGVNPLDHLLRAGHVPALNGDLPFPQVLGMEAAGVVLAIGGDPDGLAVGDRVFGFALTGAGTYATTTLLSAAATARTPAGLSDSWAATIPVAGTSALDAVDQLDLRAGATLLVNGVGGGVGLAVAQLARHRGVVVVGTASPAKQALVSSTGATFVDYTGREMPGRLRALAPEGFDGLLDLVGGASLRAVAPLTRRPSAIVSVGDPTVTELGGACVRRHVDRATLNRVSTLMVQGDFDPHITATFPFRDAVRALALVESGHARGKVIVDVGLRQE